MDVVTEVFQKYRVSCRSIWNLFFWPDADLADWDGRDRFERIRSALFESLVLQKLSLEAQSARFVVIPRMEEVPIKIEQPRQGDRNRYWDHPISVLGPSDAVLQFVDYFDWDPIGCLDFRYVKVRICAFPVRADLIGREALVEAEHLDIAVDLTGGEPPGNSGGSTGTMDRPPRPPGTAT